MNNILILVSFLNLLIICQKIYCVQEVNCKIENSTSIRVCSYDDDIEEFNFRLSETKSFPSEVFLVRNFIEILTMTHLRIEDVEPRTFEKAKNLTFLDISHNDLKELRPNMFEGATNLRVLSIMNNRISQIDRSAFKKTTSIWRLHLDGNNIQYLKKNTLKELKQLEVIGLTNNQIETLPRNLFEFNFELRHIYLQSNKLKIIPFDMFSHLEKLVSLYLQENICIDKRYTNLYGSFRKVLKTVESDLKKCSLCEPLPYEIENLQNELMLLEFNIKILKSEVNTTTPKPKRRKNDRKKSKNKD